MITRELQPEEVTSFAPQLRELQRRAYSLEAALIGDDRIPPLHESVQDLVSAQLHWVVTFDGDRIAGALGYSVEGGVVDIDRLMIDPRYHRRGLGSSLVTEVMSLEARTIVATGRDNAPARALYEALGFTHDADIEPVAGLWVSQYSRHSIAVTGAVADERR
ncbi:GNAT family N-acetyltransferase [Microbacterium sp. ZW T2_14]|uniref:GNAT family N-acetyltransferase n=1 Tax=Microbacterium sp. ZW T2_14 TaxID=3378079 RepID=UPI0038524455